MEVTMTIAMPSRIPHLISRGIMPFSEFAHRTSVGESQKISGLLLERLADPPSDRPRWSRRPMAAARHQPVHRLGRQAAREALARLIVVARIVGLCYVRLH